MIKQKDIEKLLSEAQDQAVKYVEQEARKILREHSNLNEFMMAMGTWFFIGKDGQNFDDGSAYTSPKYITESPLAKFIDEWDRQLGMTGTPMRFTADGPLRTDW